ncbi:TetR family transcriptional regulator [Kocuria koreensis]|jgi:AcrR family transcriptional regulator|uniref:TetR family transcriptional regulator n=1 Tax=Rothia koreensis TaxID=592378 RepID=A0A7K1LH48_9MICC|nr:TetR/AcrR family transcriptional regulator [Rothia koreensis]MUN54514.1 TetR family transcriptional regulator [Rothia koreensis]
MEHQSRPRRRGRPSSTRAQNAIREAATRIFIERGFSAASIRDIATAAAVDPSIVIRHFGSKEGLFLETVSVDEGLRGITDGPLEGLGERILERLVLRSGEEQQRVFRALVGAIDRAEVRTYFEQSANRHVSQPLSQRLEGPDPELRAELVTAQIAGLLMKLWVLEPPCEDKARVERLVRIYGYALQVLIDV